MRSALAILTVALIAAMSGPVSALPASTTLRAAPSTVHFGVKSVGTFTVRGAKITNTSAGSVNILVTVDREPDDFSFGLLPGQSCPVFAPAALGPGESCKAVMGFRPSDFFAGRRQTAVLRATATDPASGNELDSILIAFTGTGR